MFIDILLVLILLALIYCGWCLYIITEQNNGDAVRYNKTLSEMIVNQRKVIARLDIMNNDPND